MKTQRSRTFSGPPRSAVSETWANEMKGRASGLRESIEKGWRVSERDKLEGWEQKTGVDSRVIQITLDGMLQKDRQSFKTKYRQWIDSICDDTVCDGNYTFRVDSGVDLLKGKTAHRINTWWEIEIVYPDRAKSLHQKRLFSKESKNLSESKSCRSFSTLWKVPEEVESEDQHDTYVKATKVV